MPTTRAGLDRELQRAWSRLAAPGTWWTGAERLAIAEEVRKAPACELCRQRKEALSPYTVPGPHQHMGTLAEPLVEIVHRIVTDAGRLKRSWLRSMLDAGVTEEQYVETVGVIALVTALDAPIHSLNSLFSENSNPRREGRNLAPAGEAESGTDIAVPPWQSRLETK